MFAAIVKIQVRKRLEFSNLLWPAMIRPLKARMTVFEWMATDFKVWVEVFRRYKIAYISKASFIDGLIHVSFINGKLD